MLLQKPLAAEEAGDHSAQKGVGIELHKVQRVTSMCSELSYEGKLSTTIAFTERVDRIQIRQEFSNALGATIRISTLEVIGRAKA